MPSAEISFTLNFPCFLYCDEYMKPMPERNAAFGNNSCLLLFTDEDLARAHLEAKVAAIKTLGQPPRKLSVAIYRDTPDSRARLIQDLRDASTVASQVAIDVSPGKIVIRMDIGKFVSHLEDGTF